MGLILGNYIGIGRNRGGTSAPDGIPSNLVLTVVSDTEIDGTFTEGSTNQDGFRVYISTDNVTFTEKTTVLSGSFSATGLTANTLYYFKIVAYKGINESNAIISTWSDYYIARLKYKSLGYWRMNEASGNATDSLGLNTGIATSVSEYQSTYGVASGFKFVQDSTKRRVYCGAFSKNKYSVSLWEKIVDNSSAVNSGIIGVGGNYAGLFLVGSNGNHINLVNSAGSDIAVWNNAVINNKTSAHHLILEIDVNASTAELYYDLKSLGVKSCTPPVLANFVIANLYGGGSFYSDRSFPGIIGNVGLFEGFLTVEEKAILFNEYKENYYGFNSYNPARKGTIAFTFDDGYASFYNIVYPLFAARNKKATNFPIINYIGSSYDGKNTMSWANLLTLQNAGFEIGSHGETHTSFTTLSEVQLRAELDAVDVAFLANGLPSPSTLAYPGGQYNASVETIVADYYDMARDSIPGDQSYFPYDAPDIDKYKIGVLNIGSSTYDDIDNLKAAIDIYRYRGTIVVLMVHNIVASAPASGERTTAYLTELLDYCIEKEMNIKTFAELNDIYV